MGSLFERSKSPSVIPQAIPTAKAENTESETVQSNEETEEKIRKASREASLLRRKRGLDSTVLTGYDGFQSFVSGGAQSKKKLLGE